MLGFCRSALRFLTSFASSPEGSGQSQSEYSLFLDLLSDHKGGMKRKGKEITARASTSSGKTRDTTRQVRMKDVEESSSRELIRGQDSGPEKRVYVTRSASRELVPALKKTKSKRSHEEREQEDSDMQANSHESPKREMQVKICFNRKHGQRKEFQIRESGMKIGDGKRKATFSVSTSGGQGKKKKQKFVLSGPVFEDGKQKQSVLVKSLKVKSPRDEMKKPGRHVRIKI